MARRKHRPRGFLDLGYKSYAEYLQSDHWQSLRRDYFSGNRKRRKRCYICDATDKPLDLHHKTYVRIGRERPQDLICLCRDCHRAVHEEQPNQWAMWNTHKTLRAQRTSGV